jgi:SecD/SecF fusion protein
MKTYFIIVAIIIIAFSFGCAKKKDFEFKATIVPQSSNSVTALSDMNKAAEVIDKRLKYFFSIPQESIKLDVTENSIMLTIDKIDTGKIGQIKEVITGYHKLELWETYENGEIIGYLSKANNLLKDVQNTALGTDKGKTEKAVTREEFTKQNPLFGILRPRVSEKGEPLPSCMIGLASGKDTSVVNGYFKMDQIKALLPSDIKFYWSTSPYRYDPSKSLYELHAIKVTTGNNQAPLDGSAIISAKPVAGSGKSEVKIDLTMDSAGTRSWARITRENIKHCIAVVYDGHVRSYPRVMSEISGGNTEISGDFTIEEANDLANILKSGQLPFELKILKEQIIKR